MEEFEEYDKLFGMRVRITKEALMALQSPCGDNDCPTWIDHNDYYCGRCTANKKRNAPDK